MPHHIKHKNKNETVHNYRSVRIQKGMMRQQMPLKRNEHFQKCISSSFTWVTRMPAHTEIPRIANTANVHS